METILDPEKNYQDIVKRLSKLSVEKHFEAYVDIDWDDQSNNITNTDNRWFDSVRLLDFAAKNGLLDHLDQIQRNQFALDNISYRMKAGMQFENVLQRGLLLFALGIENRDQQFRYIHHEVIEESQHSLMFQEFVNRASPDTKGLACYELFFANKIVNLASTFPQLFFVFVLSGEDPIDYLQRQMLKQSEHLHPLLEKIIRIHVTEEARHLSFARQYLKQNNNKLNKAKRLVASLAAPIIIGSMSMIMFRIPPRLVKEYQIDKKKLNSIYKTNEFRSEVKSAVSKIYKALNDAQLVNPVAMKLWKRFHLV